MATTLQQQIEKMKAKLERQNRIINARKAGKTMQEIAEVEGLTRQRVDQILQMAEQDRQSA